jgi:hypothetical protein
MVPEFKLVTMIMMLTSIMLILVNVKDEIYANINNKLVTHRNRHSFIPCYEGHPENKAG